MKANELMTGDWVLIRRTPSCEHPYKICSINNYSILGEDYADWIELEAGEEINLEDIKPIPITAEILEKNGFEETDKCCSFKDNYCSISIYLDRIEGEEIDTASIFLEGALFDMHININYIHELQHALRLCGIDKEIVL